MSPYSDSPLKTVDRAVGGGVVWVNSAGNDARTTWFQRRPTTDRNRLVIFAGSDNGNGMDLEAGDKVLVQLRWEGSWGGANRDYDLFIGDEATRMLIAGSEGPQSGADGHIPWEGLRFEAPIDGEYAVVVKHVSGSAPAWSQVVVWGAPPLEHYTGSGSITNPGESANPGMLAVGAAPWYDVHTIEPFSSRGPTPDGRDKPDIVGADCAQAASYRAIQRNGNTCWFPGTSQSAPHVAGMAALVRQRFPDYTPIQVAAYLKDHAEQREAPDPNNTWGYGFAQLPPDDAVVPPPDARVTISPSEVNIGDTVTVTMSNYAPGLISEIKIGGVALDLTDPALAISDLVVPSSGQHSFSFVIPATVGDTPIPLGRVLVEVIGPATPGFDNHASAYITISMAETTDPCVTPLGTLTGAATETGSWTGDCDSSNRSGSHARFYSFTLEQETEVTIDLTSSQDTYLFLLQGPGKDGTVVDENDDAESGNPDSGSHITATLDAVTYTIEATTYSAGATGDFTLTITPAGTTTPTPGPEPTDPCGQTVSGDGSISGQWAEGCESQTRDGSHARYYSFALAEESEVTITLTRESGDADTYLYLREGEARSGDFQHYNDDYPESGDTDMSQIQETLEAGTYTIEATTYGAGETGSFTLTISGLGTTAQPPGPTPTDPCGQTVSGDGSVSGEWAAGCESQTRDGSHARYYSFTLAQQSEVTITLTRESGDADTYLYLREGEARSGDFQHENDDYPESGDTDMSQIRETLATGTYTIEATTYRAGETGSFTLTLAGLGAAAPSQSCSVGQTLAPGDRCSHQDFTIEVESSGALLMRFTGDEAPPQGLSLSRSGDSWSIESLP